MNELKINGGVVVGLIEEERPAEEPKAEKPKAEPKKKSSAKK